MQFNVETTAEVLGPLVLGAGPPENQTKEPDNATTPDPPALGPLTSSTGPPENQMMAGPSEKPMEANTSTDISTGSSEKPMEPNTLTIPAKPIDHVIESFQDSPPQDLPVTTPPSQPIEPVRFTFGLAKPTKAQMGVRYNSSRSPTQRRAKRQHNQHTNAGKARLIAQDVLTTRVAMQEKDQLIELLTNQVSGRLLMIERKLMFLSLVAGLY